MGKSKLPGILLFSAIETAGVAIWFEILLATARILIPIATGDVRFAITITPMAKIVATIVLFLFYVVEHIVAHNNAKDRPLFSHPRV